MLHRLRSVLVRPGRERLAGTVEVDETFIGGEEPGLRGGRQPGKKALVGVAVERAAPKGFGRCRMALLGDASAGSLRGFLTDQGAVDEAHLASYLNEFVFHFNRRRSRSRGLVFYRVLELAAAHEPVRYRDLIAKPRPGGAPRIPPSLERSPANRPSSAAGSDNSA